MELSLFVEKHDYDIVCVSEHWFVDEYCLKCINIVGYKLVTCYIRKDHIHGGVAMYAKNNLLCKPIKVDNFVSDFSAEFCALEIDNCVIITLYRSPTSEYKIFHDNLDSLLSSLMYKHKHLVLLGDFNIDFRGYSSDLKDLICLISSFGLFATISDFTRVTNLSSTCIDNIITNLDSSVYIAKVIDSCLSDHYGQQICFKLESDKPTIKKFSYRRKFNTVSLNKFSNLISLHNWNYFHWVSTDIQVLANKLVTILKEAANVAFPLTKCSIEKICLNVKWFNENLRQMRDELSSKKELYMITKTPEAKVQFNRFRSKYKNALINAKKTAYSNYIQDSDNKMKSSWQIINSERNSVSKLYDLEIPINNINVFFARVAEVVLSSIRHTGYEPIDLLNLLPRPECSFLLEPTTPQEVMDTVRSLKNSNCLDIYGINAIMLKKIMELIAVPLSNLFNLCFSIGLFPDVLKVAKVIPIFKKGDISVLNNYRPISIIPIIGKLLEILIKNRLLYYFESNNLFNHSQFGFRKNCSTAKAVSKVVRNLVDCLEKGQITSITLCDLSKAFDCVSHNILLDKLKYYGVEGLALTFFTSYLSNRKQCVVMNNVTSDLENVDYGVPQGSVLGPLLFIIYINDFHIFLNSECTLFADDTTLTCSANYPTDLDRINAEVITQAEIWFSTNKLCLNNDKTQRITVSYNNSISKGENVRLLGIVIDDALKWDKHVDDLCNKLAKSLFILRKLKNLVDRETLISIYFALFHSHLNYGVSLWANSSHAHRAFLLQKKAIRIVANAGFNEHCKPLFIKYKIMTLPSMYIYASLIEIHSVKDQLIVHSDVHSYNTRGSDKLIIPKYKFTTSKNNSRNISLFNKLPLEWKTLPDKNFKTKIKSFLLNESFYSIMEYMNKAVV